MGRTPGQKGVAQTKRRTGSQVEVLRRRGPVLGERIAVSGTLRELELGWVEALDPSRKRERTFAELKEEVVQRR